MIPKCPLCGKTMELDEEWEDGDEVLYNGKKLYWCYCCGINTDSYSWYEAQREHKTPDEYFQEDYDEELRW